MCLFLLLFVLPWETAQRKYCYNLYVKVSNAIPILTIKKPGLTEVNKFLTQSYN